MKNAKLMLKLMQIHYSGHFLGGHLVENVHS